MLCMIVSPASARFPEYYLGPRCFAPMRSMPGMTMLIRDDLRRCVVFIGTHGDESNGGINCLGTAFLLEYETVRYLVAVQHIAVGLGDSPFLIRLNKSDGTADNVLVDPIE